MIAKNLGKLAHAFKTKFQSKLKAGKIYILLFSFFNLFGGTVKGSRHYVQYYFDQYYFSKYISSRLYLKAKVHVTMVYRVQTTKYNLYPKTTQYKVKKVTE